MTAWYNEIDPHAADWLRHLISAGCIAPGDVDERDIRDVSPVELAGYRQCHFFAGIGGWSVALRLAGVPDDEPVWTGSCPCQPFSAAGRGDGCADERHLWPVWQWLIRQCRPERICGEQVAPAIKHGWLDLVASDLEGEGYAVGAAVLGAHSVGAFHIRQRLYFLADRHFQQLDRGRHVGPRGGDELANRGVPGLMADRNHARLERSDQETMGHERSSLERSRGARLLADADSRERDGLADGEGRERDGTQAGREQGHSVASACGEFGVMADADGGHTSTEGIQRGREYGQQPENGVPLRRGHQGLGDRCGSELEGADALDGFWRDPDWIGCTDGNARAVEPGTFPLAYGVSGRVVVRRTGGPGGSEVQEHWYNRAGAIKGYGNAIVPQVAANFVRAFTS